jgi:hypothetical protein
MVNKSILRHKIDITDNIVKEYLNNIPYNEAVKKIWYNKSSGLRLSSNGYKLFIEELKAKEYQFTLPDYGLSSKFLILATKNISCPYYLNFVKHSISLFGSKEASAIVLCGNDIELYLGRNQ